MTQTSPIRWKDRLQASGIHLGISLAIAVLSALLVFGLWYPYPYRDSSGGRELFLIIITVDVILGPLITLAVFNRGKPRSELMRDMTFVGLIQLLALAYGLWTVSMARPVHLVFEVDRFRVVHAIEVQQEIMDQAPPHLRQLPLTGPTVLAVRPFKNNQEEMEATMVALNGISLSARPDLWQDYAEARQRVLSEAKSVAALKDRFTQQRAQIDAAVAQTGVPETLLRSLPMVERASFWTVLLHADTAEVLAYLPLDSF